MLLCVAEKGTCARHYTQYPKERMSRKPPRAGLSDEFVVKPTISRAIFHDGRDYGIIYMKSAAFVRVSRQKSKSRRIILRWQEEKLGV